MTEDRISIDHRVMGGAPCVTGTRIPVATIVGLVAQGESAAEINAEFPQVSSLDVRAALEFSAAVAEPVGSITHHRRRVNCKTSNDLPANC